MRDFKREIILLLTLFISFSIFAGEKRVRVAIVDTGIKFNSQTAPYLCSDGHADFTGYGLADLHGHGTNIAGLIARNLNNKTHCLTIIKYHHTDKESSRIGVYDGLIMAYKHVLNLNVAYLNLSLSGPAFDQDEHNHIKTILDSGTIVTVAAGNQKLDLSKACTIFPACYRFKNKPYYVVASFNGFFSNYGGPVNRYQNGVNQAWWGKPMSGSSQACANQMAEILNRDSGLDKN
jgi:hypothetical protein